MLPCSVSPSFFLVNLPIKVMDRNDKTMLAVSSLIILRQVLGDDFLRKNRSCHLKLRRGRRF